MCCDRREPLKLARFCGCSRYCNVPLRVVHAGAELEARGVRVAGQVAPLPEPRDGAPGGQAGRNVRVRFFGAGDAAFTCPKLS
ncbi:MAG: hypothetical protein OXG81_10315 [Acidobacteria bacterium]|nr:hypothetical protein [Acidobacteriota bacterium]